MDDRSWSFTVILYLQDANHRAKKKTMCHNVSGLDWTIHGSFLWTLSQTFRSSFLMLTWYWLQLFQLWDGAGSSPLMSCLFMSLICLPANVGYTLQFLSVSQSLRKTKVLQMSAKLTCLTGSKKTTAAGTRQTKDWGQLSQHLCEKCYASGWYGMLLHGNEVMRAW